MILDITTEALGEPPVQSVLAFLSLMFTYFPFSHSKTSIKLIMYLNDSR